MENMRLQIRLYFPMDTFLDFDEDQDDMKFHAVI